MKSLILERSSFGLTGCTFLLVGSSLMFQILNAWQPNSDQLATVGQIWLPKTLAMKILVTKKVGEPGISR